MNQQQQQVVQEKPSGPVIHVPPLSASTSIPAPQRFKKGNLRLLQVDIVKGSVREKREREREERERGSLYFLISYYSVTKLALFTGRGWWLEVRGARAGGEAEKPRGSEGGWPKGDAEGVAKEREF